MPGHHLLCHTPSLGPRLQGQSHQHPQVQGNWPTEGGEGRAGDPCPSQPDIIISQNRGEVISVLGVRKGPSRWVSGALSSLHMNHPTPFLSSPGLDNPLGLTMSQGLRTAHVDHCVLLRPAGGTGGPGYLAVEGWGSRSAGYLFLFRGTTRCGRKTAVNRAGRQGPQQQVETTTHH